MPRLSLLLIVFLPAPLSVSACLPASDAVCKEQTETVAQPVVKHTELPSPKEPIPMPDWQDRDEPAATLPGASERYVVEVDPEGIDLCPLLPASRGSWSGCPPLDGDSGMVCIYSWAPAGFSVTPDGQALSVLREKTEVWYPVVDPSFECHRPQSMAANSPVDDAARPDPATPVCEVCENYATNTCAVCNGTLINKHLRVVISPADRSRTFRIQISIPSRSSKGARASWELNVSAGTEIFNALLDNAPANLATPVDVFVVAP